jgi:hypothetical protein
VSSNRDQQVLDVIAREKTGFEKYNTNTDRKDLTLGEWLNHLQEELMDATIYIERLKKDLKYRELLGLIKDDKPL